jgi:hypothetical protein
MAAPAFAKPQLSRVPRGRKEDVCCNRSSPLTNVLPYKQGQVAAAIKNKLIRSEVVIKYTLADAMASRSA